MKTNKLKACWSPLFGISLWVTAASAPVLGQTPPTYTVLTTITGFNGPVGVAVSPDNNYVYVANGQADTLVVIDAANYSVLQTLNLSESADDVALTPNGKEVYVSAGGNAGPFVINGFNTSTFAPTLTFSGGSPTGIAFSRNGKELFAAQYGASQVNVYDTAGEGSLLSQIPTGADPAQVAITPNGKRAYVTNSYAQYPTGGTVSVIDVGTRKVKGKIPNRSRLHRTGRPFTSGTGTMPPFPLSRLSTTPSPILSVSRLLPTPWSGVTSLLVRTASICTCPSIPEALVKMELCS
jgi:YVTN family beta-propeller protein